MLSYMKSGGGFTWLAHSKPASGGFVAQSLKGFERTRQFASVFVGDGLCCLGKQSPSPTQGSMSLRRRQSLLLYTDQRYIKNQGRIGWNWPRSMLSIA